MKTAEERQARVKRALIILGPNASKIIVSRCVRYIERTKSAQQFLYGTPRLKQQKQALLQFATAFRKLKAALNNEDLDQYVLDALPLDMKDIERWISYAQKQGNIKLWKRRRDSEAKRLAVKFAAHLLEKQNIKLAATRSGVFCKLAQELYGRGAGDMYELCRSFLAARRKIIQLLRARVASLQQQGRK